MQRNYQQYKRLAAMDKKQAIDIVKSYKQEILTFFPNCKIFLYGSYSKGTATSSSDIDVAVVVADSSASNWFDSVKKLWKSSRKINSLIEPVLIDERQSSPLYDEILRSGIAI